MENNVIAMILAGGKGSRLADLTKEIAKPALYYGGKYRIIDYVLSNCTNSRIDIVGVLTQYEPLILNSYIGSGSAWDLDNRYGGVTILPPYSSGGDINWYSGTASAVALNMKYIDYYQPDYVLILSGDQIYKMDYRKLIDYHIKNKAELTISVCEVSDTDASRYGIMSTFPNNLIYEFVEKPKQPKSNLASMGIYLFNYDTLKRLLTMDINDRKSQHDFGKNIIPKALAMGTKCFAYPFKGYWMDVGTIQSYWEANMDLLDNNSGINLYDNSWPIYSVPPNLPPHYIGENSEINETLISRGCRVYGKIVNSLLFYQVNIAPNTDISYSILLPNVDIKENVILKYTIVQVGVTIPEDTVIIGSRDNIILVSNMYLKQMKRV